MHINCTKCGTTTSIETEIDLKSFGCSNCKQLFRYNGNLNFSKQFDYHPLDIILEIGKKATFEGVEYEIINRLIKKFHSIYYWREYTLKSKEGKIVFLSESDGHWVLLEEIPEKFDSSRKFKTLTHNDIKFDLYENSQCNIVSAAGFYDYELPNSNIQIIEYISPPNIISIEKYPGSETTFFGRHVSKSEVKKALNNAPLPAQTLVGAIQPFPVNFYNAAIVFCVISILILITQLFVNQNRTETFVLSKEFSFEEFDNKDFVSESFNLEGGSAPMTISVHSDVDNSWANAQIALVNETTNDEIYANKDIEYYRGYTDGENWSEGSQGEKFNICGVGEGKYHLVITPQKQPNDMTNTKMSVTAVWKRPSMWNFFISVLIMGVALIFIYSANKFFENQRWENSDYSPF